MPQAVTHVLIPIILLSLFRDYALSEKSRKRFPLHYVLIGGIAGAVPDLDIAVYYVMNFFGFSFEQLHRTFSHNIFVPAFFVLLGFLFLGLKIKELGRHKLRLGTIFFVTAFGILIHLILDATIYGEVMFLYPFSNYAIGVNLVKLLPVAWWDTIIPCLEAALLILWIIYMEVKHKLSDFI